MSAANQTEPLIVIPDAGPLITLAYADSLDLLHAADAEIWIIDMVRHEVTRNKTPTSERIGHWIDTRADRIVTTEVFESYRDRLGSTDVLTDKANLGELAAQEFMISQATSASLRTIIFLFEDHRIARTEIVLPDRCTKVSTRAWLRFLERTGQIGSARSVERHAVRNGRAFSQLRFPSDGHVAESAASYSASATSATDGDAAVASTQPRHRATTMNDLNRNTPPANRRGPATVEILRLIVELDDVRPRVSRTLLIRASSPLSTLHTAIQQAMPWQDSHLHEFEKDGVRFGPDWYLDENPELTLESERKQLGTLFRRGSDSLRYLYDFGDGWSHTVRLDARLPPDVSLRRPRCIDGESRSPPEDVGGVPGYSRFLEIMSDPTDDEHDDIKAWAGGEFDPAHFDSVAVEKRMALWFPTSRRGRAGAAAPI